MEVRGLRQLAPNREIYCTMEIEGSERLQTEHVQAKKPLWDTQGDFTTNHPLPVLKIKLYAVNPSIISLEDKELGKLVLRPTVLSPKTPEWCTMQASSSSSSSSGASALAGGSNNHPSSGASGSSAQQDQELKIRVIVRMDRPQQLKHCGYLYGIGKSTWRKLKRRYHILIQVSQYTFVMCSYRDKKAKPTEMLQLEGYTVDYIEPPTDLIMEHCSEMTANELHNNSSSSSGNSALGLAGRLASVILKQQTNSSSNSSGCGSPDFLATGSGNDPSSSGSGSGGFGLGAGSRGDNENDNENDNQQQQPSAIQTAAALSDELHNKFYFNVVKEGDSVVFACDDEQECFGWVMALYRATGQAHKPTPLRNQYTGSTSHYIDAAFAYQTSATQQTKLVGNAMPITSSSGHLHHSSSQVVSSLLNGSSGCSKAISAAGGGCGGAGASSSALNKTSVDVADQRARKHGMDEFISADPCKFQHNQLFKYLQNETLKFRLNDKYCSLGWFSSGQVYLLDEYCARYGVRTCFRHLAYLNSLLDFNQRGYFIDHTLLNYGYDFCASHVSGNSGQAHPISSVNFDLRPDGVGTVTVEERDLFHVIKGKLLKMIERQISNFSYCFPFGKPDGALKTTLSLLERVLMKEQQSCNSMIQNEEVRQLIRKCLEQAALNNYTKLSGQANLLQAAPITTNQANLYTTTTTTTTTTNTTTSSTTISTNDNNNNNNITAASSLGDSFVSGSGQRATMHDGSQATGEQTSTTVGAAGGRLRTSSNQSSSSSIGSYGFSSANSASGPASSSTSGQSAAAGAGGGGSGSFKRQTGANFTPTGGSGATGQQTNPEPLMTATSAMNLKATKQCLTMAMIINSEHIKAKDKLRYLIRLAELCCEQVEESNEYFSDAFAWHSDLMMDHYELFWSLFSVDMDKILVELNQSNSTCTSPTTLSGVGSNNMNMNMNNNANNNNGPSSLGSLTSGGRSMMGSAVATAAAAAAAAASGGSANATDTHFYSTNSIDNLLGVSNNRDVFVLFQVLNNHMRKNSNLECRKFKTYLCDTFKPKLLRYIDIMESTLGRLLFKACEKDSQVNCQMIELMFNRLDDLQRFVLYQLRWPDDQLAEQLNQRLKLISYELCDACVQKTLQAFQLNEKKSNKWTSTTTSYIAPVEMIQMINLVLETRNKSFNLCTFNNFDQMSYHSKIEKLVDTALGDMQPGLMAKMLNALESTLTKLARYDEGNLLAPILSLTYKQGMSSSGKDIGKQYVTFVSNCCDLLRHKINDELWIVNLLEEWYAIQMNTVCNWLSERIDHSLHDVQLVALTNIMPKIYADMSLQGVPEGKLNLKSYQTIMSRLKMEEAAAMAGGNIFEQPTSSSIFSTSILSSLTSSSSNSTSTPPSVNSNSNANTNINANNMGQQQYPSSSLPMTGVGFNASGQQQQQQQRGVYESPIMQARRFMQTSQANNNSNDPNSSVADNSQQQDGDNIADRALQSATRMFKGFWAS